ncbi:MAG: ABC transporter ATP-binding protein [Geothrix sp.]|nr:ABC transporter ATP-binding protein [Geothrix sp.]
MTAMLEPISELKLEGITKRFPGVLACDGISLQVRQGEVLALVGENGAGKTTLMNIIMGLYRPDSGTISVNGEPVHFRTPRDAYARGIGMVHQHFMLVPNMTVAENLALGLKQLHHFMWLDIKGAAQKIRDVSERYELPVNPDAYIWQLSVGEQQRVELVKTLCLGARLLILDEPTSALTPQETDDLIERLQRMASELAIIFISHKLNEVKALSDRVSILRHGAVVFHGQTANHEPSELAALMTGHDVTLPRNEGGGPPGEPLLSVKNLRVRGDRGNLALDGLDLELRAGEILGVAGVSGNGQREFADALAGLRPVESGEILLEGRNLANRSPRAIIDAGMGYVPEDRQTEGIVPSFSVKDNLILKDFASRQFSWLSFLRRKEIDRNAEQLKERFDIRCPSTHTATGALSGGNIQKVILAREIARGPKALVAVYPTRGIDMGAQEFIHSQLLDRRREGVGIVLISEELEEVMNLSDRIAVIYKGRILKILPAVEATRERLGILMAGLADPDPPAASVHPSAGAAHE